MKPVRLERPAQKKTSPFLDLLDSDVVLRIKFYLLIVGAMALFLAVCFALKPQTYGFL